MKKTTLFKKLIGSEEILITPGIFDGITARLIQAMGFKSGSISGAGISNSRLGKPDFGLLGLTDNVDQCRNIAGCVDIPVQADADTGYGNAVSVFHTVQAFEQAGVAAVMIEDQVWPKRCGHMQGVQVIPAQEMVKKIEAAVAARKDPDLCIKGRTNAAPVMGIDEAIRRANLYADAGADLLYADAILSREDIKRFAGETEKPVMVNMGFGIRQRPTTPLISARELQEIGVAMVVYPRILSSSAVCGMRKALEVLLDSAKTGEVHDRPDLTVDFKEFTTLMGLPEMLDLDKQFLTEESHADKYGKT